MADRPLRLAILGTRGIPARYGGFETFAQEISQHLSAEGVAVTVYCETDAAHPAPQSLGAVALDYVAAPRLGPLSTIVFDLKCLWRARRGYDVVYMLGYGASLFCFLPRLFGTKVWINMDGLEWKRSKWSPLARTWLRLMEAIAMWTPDLLIADAAAIKTDLSARHRWMQRCAVIPYGAHLPARSIGTEALAPLGLSAGGYHLVVCRLEPENHVAEIIEGHRLSGSTKPLVILGNHQVKTAYVEALRNCASPAVRFLGAIYDADIVAALRTHALSYCHGHSVGGTNPSLLEALGCSSLVLAHDNVFNREVAGSAALYFEGPEALAKCLQRVEAGEVDSEVLKTRGRVRIGDNYSWARITQLYLAQLHR